MSRDEAIAILRSHEPELRSAGVVGASLFGSLARGEDVAQDADVAVRLGAGVSSSGFEYFGRLTELEERLRRLLDCEVDVVEEPVGKQRVQREIDRDRVVAF